MFTKELLLDGKNRGRTNKLKGVLTVKEVQEHLDNGGHSITSITSTNGDDVFFFSDDHCFGYPDLPRYLVPGTTQIPHKVVPRPGLEDGWVTNAEQYMFVYKGKYKQLKTMDELLEYLNKNIT